MRFDIKEYGSMKALHAYLSKHSTAIIEQKKSIVKHADSCSFYQLGKFDEQKKTFEATEKVEDNGILSVKVVINTTNIYDSHGDVHIDGIWDKHIKQATEHLREHQDGFSNVISDGEDLKAYVESFSFKDIGFSNYKGKTQALVFESDIRKDRNEYMYNHYLNNWVKQHSVGMRYKGVHTAIDDKDYPLEYANYKKYIEKVANKGDIQDGYFFAVTEAIPLEGSAVKRGSNPITPNLTNQKFVLPLATENNRIKTSMFL